MNLGCLKKPLKISPLFLLICAYSVIFTYISIFPLYSLYNLNEHVTPPTVFILLRELIYSSLIFYFFLRIEKKSLICLSAFLGFLVLTCLVLDTPYAFIAYGLRCLVPFFILISPPSRGLSNDLLGMRKYLIAFVWSVFSVHLFLQVTHLFWGRGYYSFLFSSINARNPGIYFFPAASAFLTATLALLYLRLSPTFSLKKFLPFLISLTLCSSISGTIGLFFLVALIFKKVDRKARIFLCVYLIFSAFLLHYSRYAMTGNLYLKQTGGTRFELLLNATSSARLLPLYFGQFTNAASTLSKQAVPDSFYAALIGNLGYVWSFILLGYFVVCRRFDNRFLGANNRGWAFLFLIFSFGLITTETGLATLMLIVNSRIIMPGTRPAAEATTVAPL